MDEMCDKISIFYLTFLKIFKTNKWMKICNNQLKNRLNEQVSVGIVFTGIYFWVLEDCVESAFYIKRRNGACMNNDQDYK